MNGEPGDDLSHDAHLRAALRHAPDHALAPPASLSQNILAAARQAHRPARTLAAAPPPVRVTVPPPRPISMLLRWLASPRSAGALATALVASLGVGLWLDLGNEPVVERPGSETLGATATAPAAVAVPPVSPAAPSAPAAATSPVAPTATPSVAPAEATADGAAQQAGAAQAGAARESPAMARGSAATTAPATAAEAARVANDAPRPAQSDQPSTSAPHSMPTRGEPAAPARAKAESGERRVVTTSPSPAAPAQTEGATADAPAPAAADAAARPAQQRPDETAPRPPGAALKSSRQAPPAPAIAVAPAGRIAQLRSHGVNAPGTPAPSPALTLLRLTRSELAAGSAQWEWQGPDAAREPLDDAGLAWLLRVVQGARGRWVEVEAARSADAADAAAVPLARWWRDGALHATLRFEADGLRWVEAGGRVRFAPLDAAASQLLRAR